MDPIWPILLDWIPHSVLHAWSLGWSHSKEYFAPSALKTALFGFSMRSPVMAAAGLDRSGEYIDRLLRCGFGCVEVGSVTLNLERSVKDCLQINLAEDSVTHLGTCFNWGMLKAKQNLLRSQGLRGVSITPNKLTADIVPNLLHRDYSFVISELYSLADYFVISLVSQPDLDLSYYDEESHLKDLLKEVRATLDFEIGLNVYKDPWKDSRYLVPAVAVKVNSDCRCPETLVKTCLEAEVDGLIVAGCDSTGAGGLVVKQQSLELLKRIRSLSQSRLTLIGSGGITSGSDVLEKLKAGASAVQIYSSFVTRGPETVAKINDELNSLLVAEGFSSLAEALRHYHK
jgi:dihydroorotate dehydrogenase